MSMNYGHYHERARIDRTPVTRLTPAEIQAWHERLAAEEARSERWRGELARIMAFTAELARKRAIRKAIRPVQLPLPLENVA